VEAAIRDTGIDPAAVHLEITETVLMDQPDLPKETLQRLTRLGVGLSIDDFGTGYSSLSYLKWLSARTLKIDRTFVEELGTDPHGATIIELVLGMAESLRLDVVAEGVETAVQLGELRRLGVRLAQGYLWSKPLPAERIPAWLQSHPAKRPRSRVAAGISEGESPPRPLASRFGSEFLYRYWPLKPPNSLRVQKLSSGAGCRFAAWRPALASAAG
jgi:sensor c-di-GMP phosphodiesterase-like protein